MHNAFHAALVVWYALSSIVEIAASILFAVGFWGGNSNLLITGLGFGLLVVGLSEGMKYFCRKTDARCDAYIAALGIPPLPGPVWHWFRAVVNRYRRQEAR